jgi:excisionase family DNA binding protein
MGRGMGGYVTYADAARRLGVSRQAIWKLVRAGRLGTVTVLGRRYVMLSSVEERIPKRRGQHESTWRRTAPGGAR